MLKRNYGEGESSELANRGSPGRKVIGPTCVCDHLIHFILVVCRRPLMSDVTDS